MSILDVFNVPTTDEELDRWSALHMILHRSEISAAQTRFGVVLQEFVLDPVDTTPGGSWFQQHQLMHDDIDSLLGVAQFDLIDVDWSNPAQRIGWIQGHAQLHQQETDVLGVFS